MLSEARNDSGVPTQSGKSASGGKRVSVYLLIIIILIGGIVATVKLFKSKNGPAESKASEKSYMCPMIQDNYFSDKPGKCPKCGMDLIMVSKEESRHSGIDGYATIKLTPEKQQLIGVRKGKVTIRQLAKTIRAVGTIQYNERSLNKVNTKFAGWIDKADSNALSGKFIEKGANLFSIYSPELVTVQQEYLLALEEKKKAELTKSATALAIAEQLVAATKQKLLFWDITEEQIEEIAKSGKPSKTMWITASAEGFIINDELINGKYVMPGEVLFHIVDLSTVWVNAEIYEYEIPHLKVGDKAEVEVSYYPDTKFEGTVSYIYPYLNPTTRTVKVRISLPNPDYKLKVDMYVKANFQIDFGEKLAIPIESVLDSGKRQIVFVDKGEGFFEPREVKLGIKTEDYYEVISGLSDEETIVTSANFLLDSESKLKAVLLGTGADDAAGADSEHKQH